MIKRTEKINLRRMILFHKFDEYINMSPAEVRIFKQSEEAEDVSQDRSEADIQGGRSGKEASKELERIVSKCTSFRNQFKKLPDLTNSEWDLVGDTVRMIARFRKLKGAERDEDGDLTPKVLALKYWFHDTTKYKKHFPTKEEIKHDVVTYVKALRDKIRKETEKQKEKEDKKKINEDFFRKYLDT